MTKLLSIVIVACACAGIVGVFLPLMGSQSLSLWQYPLTTALWIYGGLALALVCGVAGALAREPKRWQPMFAVYGFLVIGLKFRTGFFDLFTAGDIGGRLIGTGTLAGAIAGAICWAVVARSATS